jgi:molybdate transport system substrate-binding protein
VIELHVLSAGAAKGVVTSLAPAFEAAAAATLHFQFGAVGAIRDQWLAGAPCDVVILTAAMIEMLVSDGRVVADTVAPLGRVRTGVAVRVGEALPAIADRVALRQSLAAATALYVPDTDRSTAGAHFLKVLRELGISDDVVPRLRAFPNGAIAMRELAQSSERGLIGCTQITEINYTPGVFLVGALPKEFELSTVYSVAVAATSPQQEAARHFAQMLSGSEARELRRKSGFEY